MGLTGDDDWPLDGIKAALCF